MENDNNFGYDKITIVVDNIPLMSADMFSYKEQQTQDKLKFVYLMKSAHVC